MAGRSLRSQKLDPAKDYWRTKHHSVKESVFEPLCPDGSDKCLDPNDAISLQAQNPTGLAPMVIGFALLNICRAEFFLMALGNPNDEPRKLVLLRTRPHSRECSDR